MTLRRACPTAAAVPDTPIRAALDSEYMIMTAYGGTR
jgi:hypothetical protein